MDISNLIIQLQAKFNDLTYNQLAVAKSIELLKTKDLSSFMAAESFIV